MPELPEVEIYRRYFERHALKRRVAAVEVRDQRILDAITPQRFISRLKGRSFVSARRHGKHLFAPTDAGFALHLHFGMTGDLLAYGKEEAEPSFARVVFRFARGFLAFDDMRLFGLAGIVEDVDQFIEDAALGIDPLDRGFTLGRLREALHGRRGAIKPLLMNQRVVAGLGNLYMDEVLYRIGVDPRRKVEDIDGAAIGALHRAIRKVLTDAIEVAETGKPYPRSFFLPDRDEGARCRRCGAEIRRIVVGGRTTLYCPGHQH